jgi:guanine deaminase
VRSIDSEVPPPTSLAGHRITAWALLHAATRGAAVALQLEHEIGSFEPGCQADLCLWDWAVGPVATRRETLARELHERLFAWLTLGDERNLAEVWVGGVRRHARA